MTAVLPRVKQVLYFYMSTFTSFITSGPAKRVSGGLREKVVIQVDKSHISHLPMKA